MNFTHSVLIVVVAAAVTVLLRVLPFAVFGGDRETPPIITYLGRVLPYAIMGMLIVFCLKDVSFISGSYGAPEVLSCALVVLLHIWKRNTLLSIAAGTVCYMVLIQAVF